MKEHENCRVCGGLLEEVLDLGELYPSAFVENSDNLVKVPLVLTRCKECTLVQLRHTTELDLMYRQYWYRSGLNKSMIKDLEDIVRDIEGRVTLGDGDVVVDIGCNDGTLFSFFTNRVTTIGYDPAYNLAEYAKKTCDYFINDYFPAKYPISTKAKVITSIAMFYDLEDPNDFVTEIKKILADDGIWVIQFTDLLSMFSINAFDNICHEHLEYYSLRFLVDFMRERGLEVFSAGYNEVNGGSLRIFVSYLGVYEVEQSVYSALDGEQNYLDSFDDPFRAFSDRVEEIKIKVKGFVVDAVARGESVYVLGASTKGNSLLQIFEIDNSLVPFAAEVNAEKYGLKTVGTGIEIVSQEEALMKNPEYFLVLPFHFRSTFEVVMADYINRGGSLIFPLPHPEIVSKDGVRSL